MGKRYVVVKGIKFSPRKIWELGSGHHDHRSGAGYHDHRPKRARTRRAAVRQHLKEWD